MELNNEIVEAILLGESPYLEKYDHADLPSLDLSNFRYCSDSTLDRLVSNIGPLDSFDFGLEYLPLGHALKLRRLSCDFFYLTNLINIDDGAAYALGGWPFGNRPIRIFECANPISEEVARGLVGTVPSFDVCDRPLSLNLPSLSPEVANVLRRQTHELYLGLTDEKLSPEVAALLAKHSGYHMQLTLPSSISPEARVQLSSNPAKRISIQRGGTRIYVVDHDWWTSGYEERLPPLDAVSLGGYLMDRGMKCSVNGEFVLDLFLARRLIEDGLLPKLDKHTHLDLSIFGDITPEALHYLCGFECENIRLGIHRLDIVAAKFLSGWKTRFMCIDGDVEFIPSALLEFERFVGNLYLGRIDGLDRDTAEALAKIDGDVSFSTPSISIHVAAALARHPGELHVKGLEQLDAVALSELVRHRGDRLILMLDCEPELDCIRAITSNPDKRVFRFKGEVYEALNSKWAVMVCSMDRCAEFTRFNRMTEADIVSTEALVDERKIDPLSIANTTN